MVLSVCDYLGIVINEVLIYGNVVGCFSCEEVVVVCFDMGNIMFNI